MRVTIEAARGGGHNLLTIYHLGRELILSDLLPLLENAGLRVLEQLGTGGNGEGVTLLRVRDSNGQVLESHEQSGRLAVALAAVLEGKAQDDPLNSLITNAGLTHREVELVRAYEGYYAQASASFDKEELTQTLLAHPKATASLVEYYAQRFDPLLEGDREAGMREAQEQFEANLHDVSSVEQDRALRGIFALMAATVRTNYFQGREYISFKIASRQVEDMPQPKPMFEVGVASPTMEGTHMRGGKVARGGIRWSDRLADYRTEVLGLTKTQMTKNAVIVPVGSKGGFVVKDPPRDRDALFGYVRSQYQTFIRGLLDLTDNLVDGEVVRPEGLVIYDEDDTYMVVAADKGTATFSDVANAISEEYGFWLGDAFASGGSHGYDHKKMGITARGAWETVSRHFRESGVNVLEDEFTVAGIGDMSGDVFGNGMLYTDKIKLVAAFNHMHIFIDPNPDPVRSFAERKRLFELPRSTWRDYDTSLISEGGGVFDRSDKSIPLSPQIREALDVYDEALSGQELIRAILRAPVDLLWNGGIGTYVKASSETDIEVGDRANDSVRVHGSELRAKVVGEGGNLGFTQRGRIEYALGGGRINTDFIDNSGGVDMSDHEVNIKILFQPIVESGRLSFEDRNALLEEMSDEATRLVLENNYRQSLALTMAQQEAARAPQLYASLQEHLAAEGGLDPVVEFLPNREEFAERLRRDLTYTRPELAVLMAYTKMDVYNRLLETGLPDEERFRHFLYSYFPEVLGKRYPEDIDNHPLGREIVATQLTNALVDYLGVSFVFRNMRDSGARAIEVIRAALVSLELLDAKEYLGRVFELDNRVPTQVQHDLMSQLKMASEGLVHWVLDAEVSDSAVVATGEASGNGAARKNGQAGHASNLRTFVEMNHGRLARLLRELPAFLPGELRESYEEHRTNLAQQGVGEELAVQAATYAYLAVAAPVLAVAQGTRVSLEDAGRGFFQIGDRLSLNWLRRGLKTMDAPSKWERMAVGSLITQLRRAHARLSRNFVTAEQAGELSAQEFLAAKPGALRRYDDAISQVREDDDLSLASGAVLIRFLNDLAEANGQPS